MPRPRLPTTYLSAIPPEERGAVVMAALRARGGSLLGAATHLECPPWYLTRLLEQLGLRDEPARIREELAARYRLPARTA